MKSALVFVFAIFVAGVASAYPVRAAPQVTSAAGMLAVYEQRRADQLELIRDGLRDGLLTAREGKSLMKGQRRIEKTVRRAARDRVITGRELTKIERLLSVADARIDTLSFNETVAVAIYGRSHVGPHYLERVQRARAVRAPVVVRPVPVRTWRAAPVKVSRVF